MECSIWIPWVWITSGSGMRINYFFTRSCRTCVFQNLIIWNSRLITPGDEGIPNKSKVMYNLVEMITRQNLPNKGGETEIDSTPVGENWMEYPKCRDAYNWLLNFLTPIELSETTIPEWTEEYPLSNRFLL